MNKNIEHKVYDDIRSQGKISENRIIIVMTVLITLILALNWVAYHSVEVVVPQLDQPIESQQTTSSKTKQTINL